MCIFLFAKWVLTMCLFCLTLEGFVLISYCLDRRANQSYNTRDSDGGVVQRSSELADRQEHSRNTDMACKRGWDWCVKLLWWFLKHQNEPQFLPEILMSLVGMECALRAHHIAVSLYSPEWFFLLHVTGVSDRRNNVWGMAIRKGYSFIVQSPKRAPSSGSGHWRWCFHPLEHW